VLESMERRGGLQEILGPENRRSGRLTATEKLFEFIGGVDAKSGAFARPEGRWRSAIFCFDKPMDG
jgi:hypothetical protein